MLSQPLDRGLPRVINAELPMKLMPIRQPKRFKVAYGGRGSAKSWSFARTLIILALNKKLRILCVREFQNSIADSVHALLADQIKLLGLQRYFRITDKAIYSANGSKFFFRGLHHNAASIKSIEGVDICWIEEAERMSQESWDYLEPTIRKPGSEIWISFNPNLETDPVYKTFIKNTPEDCLLINVSWRDNPWFSAEMRAMKNRRKLIDPEGYMHIWEGHCKKSSKEQVFRGKWEIADFEYNDVESIYLGADWGFATDPTTLIRCFIRNNPNTGLPRLYISHEAWAVGCEMEQLEKLFETVPDSKRYMIRADSARPETISYVSRKGFAIEGAKKGKGSVEDGIEYLRGTFEKIVIHSRCMHTSNEFQNYSYKVDKLTKDVLPELAEGNDHCIDALRYALEPMIKKQELLMDFL